MSEALNTQTPSDSPSAGADGSEELDIQMMTEWSASLRSRLYAMDLRHAEIALKWFTEAASSYIEREKMQRACRAVVATQNAPTEQRP